jgi:hypothetical protein
MEDGDARAAGGSEDAGAEVRGCYIELVTNEFVRAAIAPERIVEEVTSKLRRVEGSGGPQVEGDWLRLFEKADPGNVVYINPLSVVLIQARRVLGPRLPDEIGVGEDVSF